jgi:hypothetical protein
VVRLVAAADCRLAVMRGADELPPLPPFTYTWVRARRDEERARIRRAFVVRGRLGPGPGYGSNL